MAEPNPIIENKLFENIFINPISGCRDFIGPRITAGYGDVRYNSKHYSAHRLSYSIFIGPIPNGFDLHHRCENRACVNPQHLTPLSRSGHVAEHPLPAIMAALASKTHCLRGHELAGNNLLPTMLKHGRRSCRICHRQRVSKYKKRKRISPVLAHTMAFPRPALPRPESASSGR